MLEGVLTEVVADILKQAKERHVGMSLVEDLGALDCAHHVNQELKRKRKHAFRTVHLAIAANHLHHILLNEVLYKLPHT